MLTLLARYGLINSVEAIMFSAQSKGNSMNTYEKAQHGATLFLDADAAREGSFAYYALEVLEGDSEPSHTIWADCVKGAQAKLCAVRATALGLDTEQAFLAKKTIGEYGRKKWQLIKAGIVQFHLDQDPPREFVAPATPLTDAQIAVNKAKEDNKTDGDRMAEKAIEAQRAARKLYLQDMRQLGDRIETDIKTIRNLGFAAIKIDDAAGTAKYRAILEKLSKSVAKLLPAE
jgi:hypothetical protein